MMLIDGAISIPPTRIGEIPSDAPFEKALATCEQKIKNVSLILYPYVYPGTLRCTIQIHYPTL